MAPGKQPQLTPERQAAKDEYYAWKRVLKREPKANDLAIIKKLWRDALRILNHGDKEEKQWLPRDLDSDETNGRQHIRTLMEMKAHADGSSKFVELAKPFLEVITHPALLDCISVDTAVGGLFNFISGSNGKRAILFFNNLSGNLLNHHVQSEGSASMADTEKIVVAALTALRELLVRENRVALNDDLPDLVATLENIASITDITQQPVVAQIINNKIREIRRMIARATGLLQREEDQGVMGISAPAVVSTKVQREVVLPDGRHDNDRTEIPDIKILPTEDEIRSDAKEFLPSTDLDQPHFLTDAAERHIDTFFRLLRHDIFGELKEGLGGLMHAIERNPTLLHSSRLILGDHVRAYSYPGAFIKQISPDARGGLDVHISFKQPPWIGKASPQLRRKYWEEARRLDEGVLLCFVSLNGTRSSVLFFTTSWKKTGLNQQNSLSKDSEYATVTTHLAARYEEDLKSLIRLSHTTSPLNPGVLIELPGVILGTFLPILETLQSMQKFSRLPFRQWILPEETSNLDIPPPLYARLPGFKFTLDSICKVNGTCLSLDVGASVDDLATINLIEEKTGLDKGQCKALIAALTREYALIQGPPGTGKSYVGVQLMRVLLDCKDIGPIVVVSFPNHALDQFLEHLIQIGVGHVIRVGGQSKSDVLKSRNIRQVATAEAKTKSENLTLWRTKQALEDLVGPTKEHLALLDEVKDLRPTWRTIKVHLSDRYASIYSQFSKVDEDGFSSVGDPFEIWIKGNAQSKTTAPPGLLSIDQLLDVANQDIHALKPWDRRRIFEHWKTEISEDITEKLFDTIEESERLRKERSKISDEINRRALEKAQVIGLTTTGLAGNINILQHIGCKVVICEEAGEVMEPHMLSALLPSCEHFIQIGDHQQLRPRINNFKLSLESEIGKYFQLDRSQFERLSIPEQGRPAFPVAQLNVQRRMRPEVSNLIKQTIYPRLVDHHSTLILPSVIGMRDDVFWLDHNNFEDGARGLRPSTDPDQHSFSNAWEVDMVHALVKHIVRQGVYSSSDIAVLTPYTGQLKELRSKMRNDFEIFLSDLDKEDLIKDGFEEDIKLENEDAGENTKSLEKKSMINLLRLSTVDNFQGEESKIILVSLVRSNAEKKVGFLRTTNRINVLLSRAQHGMYLIGNARTYSNVPMWEQVLGLLSANDNISDALSLQCPRHPETEIKVSTAEDFAVFSPEGGCTLICDRKLSCGHKCVSRCHSENLHQVFACPLPCQRLHSPCKHLCQKETCGEPCGKCMFRVDNVQLPCGHSKDNVPCCLTQDRTEIECAALVQKAYPGCDHPVTVQCGQDVKSVFRTCPAVCNADLDCGHACYGACGKCNVKSDKGKIVSNHPTCKTECGRRLSTCNHRCTQPCHKGKDCGTCISACEIGCGHWQNNCTLQCSAPCLPCTDDCTWSCTHQGACSMPCSAPCNRLPCDHRCSKKLACGHQCPGICGESCPHEYCQVCTKRNDDFVDIVDDMYSERRKYADIKLDEEPIMALTCGHFFTAKRLDTVVGLEEVYVQDQGGFTLLKDSSNLSRARPKCPECHIRIQQYTNQRYNRLINRAVIDDNSKRFQVSGQADILDLDLKIEELENALEISRDAIVQLIRRAKDGDGDLKVATVSRITRRLRERDAQSFGLVSVHGALKKRMEEKIKPAKDLHDATVLSLRERSIDEQLSALSLTVMTNIGRDRRVTLGLEAVFFRLMSIIVYDCFIIFEALKLVPSGASIRVTGGSPVVLARPFFDKCSSFIETCQDENLLKLSVEATLYYAKIARHYETSHRLANPAPDNHHSSSSKYLEEARKLLKNAKEMCTEPFRNSKNLGKAVTKAQEILGEDMLYEELEVGEVDPINEWLMSGRQGTAKNFGDWHLCENGHPFAEDKRASPMEITHCPECGAIPGGVIRSSAQGAGFEPEEGYVLEG